jgi:hypothetical protein
MARRWRVEAMLCALAVAICVLASWPFAETGMTDDFSYIRTAQVFAATGHIVFNGWASAMLGWQLLPAAVLIKVFGFSFTIVRVTTLLVAMATAFLMQRTMVRAGAREWNATVGTLTMMLSPLMLPLSFNFLSDMWSLFSILLCLYGCLRALEAATDRAAMGWILFAAVGNGVTGTTRQIAWLGLLVMVPSTLWLLRGRKRVFWVGVAGFVVGLAIMGLAMHWFNTRPYTLPEPLKRKNVRGALKMLPDVLVRPALEIPMLMLPVLLMFAAAVRGSGRRAKVWIGVVAVFFVGVAVHLWMNHTLTNWLVPFEEHGGSLLSRHGMYTVLPTFGAFQPAPPFAGVPEWLRLVLAAAPIVGVLFLAASFAGRKRGEAEGLEAKGKLPWRSLLVVLVPFGLAYVCLLAPRGLANLTLDRYLLPLVLVALFLAVRWYQDRVRANLPVLSLVLVLVIAAGSVAAMHDVFSMYRTMLAAAAEMQAAGVPRDKIDGGFEYNGWTQIIEGGFVHQEGIRVPPGVDGVGVLSDNVCPSLGSEEFPSVKPEYSLSYDRNHCGGPSQFAPVMWSRWWSPHEVPIFIVKNPIIPGNHKMLLPPG